MALAPRRTVTSFYLLTFGVLLIYGFHRLTSWMHARGWIQWKMRRGTSSALGNAVLGAQVIFQPQVREVLEIRLDDRGQAGESGDPPEPGVAGWETPLPTEEVPDVAAVEDANTQGDRDRVERRP